jgi:hypothetical protein
MLDRRLGALLALSLALSLPASDTPDADACAIAPPRGADVRIAEEEAIIVWDPATKTEHFIRKAGFQSTTPSFGFLVPTPTTPALGEVPDHLFDSLAEELRPEVRVDTSDHEYELGTLIGDGCLGRGGMKKSAPDTAGAPRSAVRVLQTATVAGFDATTVEADDAGALTAWLAAHGFESTPALTAWLERYVADHWKITAFVVATDEREGTDFSLATRAVKMSFQTERPFYPYREPTPAPPVAPAATDAGRLLRLWFLSDARHAATLADQPWSAEILLARPTGYLPEELTSLAGKNPFVTAFADVSSPRRAIDELYFAPSADQAEVRPPPITVKQPRTTLIPVDAIIVFGLGVFLVVPRRDRTPRRPPRPYAARPGRCAVASVTMSSARSRRVPRDCSAVDSTI